MIDIRQFTLGPLENNSFLIFDPGSKESMVINPSFEPNQILTTVKDLKLTVKALLLTHAHFDHIAGVGYLNAMLPQPLEIGVSSADAMLYAKAGNARLYGFNLGELPPITLHLSDGQILSLGNEEIEVRAVPGHTPGHLMFYIASIASAFCGDLIFRGGVGRTDLPGGDWNKLLESIHIQVFTLPANTVLYPGHGPSTTVADEMESNPFLK